MPHTIADHADQSHRAANTQQPWQQVLDTLYAAGADAGAAAADWWAQDSVGGRASGDTAITARMILAGIDDGDPLILDALPGCALPDHAVGGTEARLYADAAPRNAPDWDTLSAPARAQAIDAFRDGYDTTIEEHVADHCRTALPDDDTHSTPDHTPRA